MEELPIKSKDIAEATRVDPVLARVLEFTLDGWPAAVTDMALNNVKTILRTQGSTDS